ncbi:MAG: hypothetical protein M1350_00485, partial [Actinobacteria bacterium]|nr:hypothetical protein [Actinomycetota bacterium]
MGEGGIRWLHQVTRERFSHGKALSEILISLWSYLAISFCIGVDSEGNALTWNGSSWSSQDIDGTNNLVSVSCPSVFGCMAVDGD